jgi:UDP-glucose 4-epimerase
VADVVGVPCRTLHFDARREVKIAFSDHSKASAVFGVQKKTPLEQGLDAMAAWVQQHGARESSVFENIEVLKNLPPSWAEIAFAHPRPLQGDRLQDTTLRGGRRAALGSPVTL